MKQKKNSHKTPACQRVLELYAKGYRRSFIAKVILEEFNEKFDHFFIASIIQNDLAKKRHQALRLKLSQASSEQPCPSECE